MNALALGRCALSAIAAATLLAACGGSQPPIGAPGAMPQVPALGASTMQPATTTCAKSPPQYQWIFGGACDRHVTLQSTGGSFSLAEYDSITVKGAIGQNTTKGTATITIADATDANGDVAKWKGKVFPKYIRRGTTFLYAVAINQSNQTIKMISVQGGPPVLRYVVTDANGLPGKTCGGALLSMHHGHFVWTTLPGQGKTKGNRVTITQYVAPVGFEIPPKTARLPLYFAVYCYS